MRRGGSALAALAVLASLIVFAHPTEAQPSGGAMAGMTAIQLQIGGINGVPEDAELAALHVAVAGPVGPGFVTVWPCTEELPTASSVNYQPGQVVQSLVLAKLDESGAACIYVLDTADLIVDVAGYVPAGSDLNALDTPTRILDSRFGSPLVGGQELRVPIRGRSGVPVNADGVGFTLTALNGVAPGFATVYPCDTPRPDSSNVNWLPGQFVPNFVFAKLGAGGDVCIWALSQTDLIIDLVAWMPTDAAGLELLDQPIRSFDTRDGTGTAARPFGNGESRSIPVGAPADAVAVLGNITAADQGAPGLATVYPCGVPAPTTASLNWVAPPVAMNASFGPLGDGGRPCVFSLHPTDLIYDVMGYVTSPDFYTPMTPFRLYDSREDWEARCPFEPMVIRDGNRSRMILLFQADGNWRDDPRIDAVRNVLDAQVTSDCERVAASSGSGDMLVFDVSSGLLLTEAPMFGSGPWTASDDDFVLSAYLEPIEPIPGSDLWFHDVVVEDRLNDDLFHVGVRVPGPTFGPGLNPDPVLQEVLVAESGRHVAILQGDGPTVWVTVVDIFDGILAEFEVDGYDQISNFDVSPDGRAVVITSTVRTPTGDPRFPELSRRYDAYSLAGRPIASGTGDSLMVAGFRGPGELLVCGNGTNDYVIQQHDLFGSPRIIERFAPFGPDDVGTFHFENACLNNFHNLAWPSPG